MNAGAQLRRGAAIAALLLVTGLAASALPGSAAAQETDEHGYEYVTDDAYEYPDIERPGKPDHRKSDGKDKYPKPGYPTPPTTPPTTSPPATTPPTTSPPPTSPPTTAPPSTSPPTTPTTAPPTEQPELPVTGARSLNVAGFGLLLVGLGMLAWMLGGRRRARV